MEMKKKISIFLAVLILFSSLLSPMQVLASDERDLSIDSFDKTEELSSESFRVIVQARSDSDKETLKTDLSKSSENKVLNDYDLVFNGFSMELTESAYLKLMMDPRVVKVTKAKVFYPLMTSSKTLGQVFEAGETFKNKGEGMVIAIIDSGLDLTHKDFQNLDNPSKAKIQEIMPFGGENKDTHFTIKVPYGFNFADNSYRVKGYESDHGIHVAGIAGANSDDSQLESFAGIDGVASQAQILSMGVFSNNPENKGAQEDDIIAAIEKSIEKGADIINMSLGTDSGFMNDQDPTSMAIKKAKDKGILVVVAAGNETSAFSLSGKNGIDNPFNRKDIGVVSSPSTYRESFSVASFENTFTFVNKFNFVDGEEKIEFNYNLDNGEYEDRPYRIVEAGLGRPEDFKDKKFAGKLALIKRGGDITFIDKATRAKNAGAIGAIIYNTDDSSFKMSLSGIGNFPVFNISNTAGMRLLEAYNKNSEFEVSFSKEARRVANVSSGDMSDFTSFGSTPDFDFKPEITGIGGQVYSTVNDGKYAISSGTSMASPYVSGVSAIVYSQVRKDVNSIGNVAEFTRKTLMNTAKILYNSKVSDTTPFSVRRQGAGLVQAKDAIDNRVILSYENEAGNAAGELRNFNGVKSFNINLKNYSDRDLTFKVKTNGVFTTETVNKILIESPSSATIASDLDRVTVKANSSANVNITIDASSVVDNFVEGFVEFISEDSKQPSLSFPYMGFVGNYNAENIMDNLDTVENDKGTIYKDTRLVSIVKDPRNIFDSGRIFTLGLPVSELNSNKKPSQEMWSISPNGDGFADVVIPQLGLLRNAKTLEFSVLDSEMNTLRILGKQENVRRQMYKDFESRTRKKELFTVYPFIEGYWDGKIYNSQTGKFEVVKDGQYYIQAAARINLNESEQKLLYPIKVDTVSPKISLVKTQTDEDYSLTKEGRLVTFKVEDQVGVATVYGKVGNKKFEAVKQDDGTYTVLLPFNVEVSDSLKLVANDFALNESSLTVNGIKGNSLTFVKWEKLVSKKINALGIDYTGSTTNPDTKFISIQFINKKTKEVINSTDARVINGKFAFASYTLKNDQQGKYEAFAIEKDKDKKEIKRTSLGDYVYDYTSPKMEFNFAEKVEGDKVKNPLKSKSTTYVEYIMMKNPDGTATFKGKVSDNVFEPNELKLTIGSRDNVVAIQKDGSFEYVLKAPSIYYDFINLSQPGPDGISSSTVDALDLAVTPSQGVKKGLERTYVIHSYIESDKPLELPEFKLTAATKVIINKDNLGKDSSMDVEKIGDEYYYTISGFTNRRANIIYIDGKEATLNDAVDGSSRFVHKVKINEGSNAFNLRATDLDGNVLKDLKIRVILDTNLPNFVLQSPEVAEIEKVEIPKEITSENETETGQKKPVEYEEFEIVETWKDQVNFKGLISDAGLGYSLIINGDVVEKFANKNVMGTVEKEFSKQISVKDQDIITLELSDAAGNSTITRYKIRKVEPPRIIEVTDKNQEKDELFARVNIKLLEEKFFDVLKGQVLPEEILPVIEDTEDYKFAGWFTDSNLTYPLENTAIAEDITIYPKFEKIEPSVEKENEKPETPDIDEDGKPSKGDTDNKSGSSLEGGNNNSQKTNSTKDPKDDISKLLPRREENPQLPNPDIKSSEPGNVVEISEENSQNNNSFSQIPFNKNSLTSSTVDKVEDKKESNIIKSDQSNENKTAEAEKSPSNEIKEEEKANKGLDSGILYYFIGGIGILSALLFILFAKRKKDNK